MNMLICLTVVIILLYICLSKHHYSPKITKRKCGWKQGRRRKEGKEGREGSEEGRKERESS